MRLESGSIFNRGSLAVGLAALMVGTSAASATVKFADDFEDADLDNLGYAIKDVDVNLDGAVGQWVSANPAFHIPPVPPAVDPTGNPPIDEVADPQLPSTGLRWHASRGFTGSGDPKAHPVILNDTPWDVANTTGLPDSAHINTGLAMGVEGKGRSTSLTGFFDPTPTPGVANDQRLALGLNVGDEVKVSFDWRVWESVPNANTPIVPNLAQLRFGLFQDTDNELGLSNSFAGPGGLAPAVWGQEDGLFRGDLAGIGPGANGDAGVMVKLFIGDENFNDLDLNGEPDFTGNLNRIGEERNNGVNGDFKFLEGPDFDTVASPTPGTVGDPSSFFPLLKVGKVYNIELSIVRTVQAAFQGDPNGLWTATVTVNELDANGDVVATHSFGDEESAGDPLLPDPDRDGIQSDVWDYIAFRNSSGDPEQDFDFIIDNLVLEECVGGCNPALAGDLDGDGFVGIADLNIVLGNWNTNVPGGSLVDGDPSGDGFVGIEDLNTVLGNWNAGTPPANSASIPEPASLALLGLGSLASLRRRR